ncbi:MAG: SMI1/KNR4 family protein [Hamadaea sp.]|uniref:SMI1/KNR4 family protein n=1 Tax=Hamadaea sp. TaxID=2024425 RepID=UPI00182E4113|nr:SMI1/KNR4 family protein [Hamadaea sp.]NUT17816.1 SMI1/KNR4 family protein [Hamadaea sp.]
MLLQDSAYFTGPPLSDELIRRAEESLGVKLPRSYLDVLRERNGGTPVNRCCPTPFPTSWAPDHFEIHAVLGVGGSRGIDTPDGSAYLVAEWGYPEVGVVVCAMPSGGHDAVMLDYSECGPVGEPAVAYVDEDRVPRRVAASFAEFLGMLVACDGEPPTR